MLLGIALSTGTVVQAQAQEPDASQGIQEEQPVQGAEISSPSDGEPIGPEGAPEGVQEQEASQGIELNPIVVEGDEPSPAAPPVRSARGTAPIQTAVPAPLPEPEPEGVERSTFGGEPTAYSPVEGYVATRSATGTKTDTPIMETPQSISVIGVEQMQDQGVQTLQEAVRYTPGVFADGFGLDTRNDYAIIRGIPAAYFIDGLQTQVVSGSNSNTIQIEPYALERIEVLRGPSSMLYGATSAGGIINGVSKRPTLEPFAEAGIDYGSFDFKQVRGDVSGPISEGSDWYYRITALGRRADTQVDYVDNDRFMIQPALSYRPDADTDVTFIANFRKDDGGSVQQFMPQAGTLYPNINGRIVPRDTFTGEPGDYYNTEQQSGTLLIDKTFNNKLKFHSGTRYTHTENEYDSTLPAPLTPARFSILNSPFANLLGTDLVIPDYAPFLDASQEEVARVRFVSNTETEVFNQDAYLTGEINTGRINHEITGGVDFMSFKEESSRADSLDNLLTSTSVNPGVVPAAEAAAFAQAYPIALAQIPSFVPPATAQALATQFANDYVAGLGINRQSVLQLAGYPGFQKNFNLYNPSYGPSDYQVDLGTFSPVDPNNLTLRENPTERQYQTGVYLQDQIRLGNWIGILGIRQDWVNIGFEGSPDTHEQATSGRAALMYEFDAGWAPYITWSQSFTPQPGQIVSDELFVRTNARAATPREGEQIEVGLKIQPDGSRFGLYMSAYQLTEENLVVSPDTLFETLIGAEVEAKGFEIEAIGNITDELKVIGAYSYTDAKYTDYPDPLGIKIGTQREGAPPHLASLWGIYTFSRGWLEGVSIGGGVRYIGEIEDVAVDITTGQRLEVTTPSVTLFDASLAYETDNWRWAVTAQNLEDTYYVLSCTAFRGDCAIGQARTVIGSATYKF
ncbi:TonB-dependent siderophore receptor [Methyloligella halotolerans]|nr:TonB-dependent receptor [Methyloligella halotolerans]